MAPGLSGRQERQPPNPQTPPGGRTDAGQLDQRAAARMAPSVQPDRHSRYATSGPFVRQGETRRVSPHLGQSQNRFPRSSASASASPSRSSHQGSVSGLCCV